MSRLRSRRDKDTGEQPATAGETGDSIVPGLETRTDESLDQLWALHLQAKANADALAEQAAAAERRQEAARQRAQQLRDQAAELVRQAEEADAAERAEAERVARLRADEARARAVAADHADTVELRVRTSGRQHPAERAQNPQVTHPDVPGALVATHGPETQGMPVISPDDPLGTGGYPTVPANGAPA